jgi:hypothetical protein
VVQPSHRSLRRGSDQCAANLCRRLSTLQLCECQPTRFEDIDMLLESLGHCIQLNERFSRIAQLEPADGGL